MVRPSARPRSTIAEVRKWYDGGLDEDDDDDHRHHHHHRHHHLHIGSARHTAATAAARGTVFEFYDTYGEVPPTRLSRKGAGGLGGVRDYHWTAALTLRMMAEEAAMEAAGRGGHHRHHKHKKHQHNRDDGGGSGGDAAAAAVSSSSPSVTKLPEWVPAARSFD